MDCGRTGTPKLLFTALTEVKTSMPTHGVFVVIAYSSEKYSRIVKKSSDDGPSDDIVHDVKQLKLPQPDNIVIKGHERVHLSWEMGAVEYKEFYDRLQNIVQEISNVKSGLLHELNIDSVTIAGYSPEGCSPDKPTETHSGATQTGPTDKSVSKSAKKRTRTTQQEAIDDDAEPSMKRACGPSDQPKNGPSRVKSRGRKGTTNSLDEDGRHRSPSKRHPCPNPDCPRAFDRPNKLQTHVKNGKCGPPSKARNLKKPASVGNSLAAAGQTQNPVPNRNPKSQRTFTGMFQSYPQPYVYVPYPFQAYAAPPMFVNPLTAPQPNPSAIINVPTQLSHTFIAPEGSTTHSTSVSQETVTLGSSGSCCEDAGPDQVTVNQRGTTLPETSTACLDEHVPSGCQEFNPSSSETTRGIPPVSKHPDVSNSEDAVELRDEPERVATADFEPHRTSDGSSNEVLLATGAVSTEAEAGEKDISDNVENHTSDGSSNEISDRLFATGTASTYNETNDKEIGRDNADSHQLKDVAVAAKECQTLGDGDQLQFIVSVLQSALEKTKNHLDNETDRCSKIEDAKRVSAAEVEAANKLRCEAEEEAQRERQMRIDCDTRRMNAEEALASIQRNLGSERAARVEAESTLQRCESDLCLATGRLQTAENQFMKEKDEKVLLEQELQDLRSKIVEAEQSLAVERHNSERMRTEEALQSDRLTAAVLLVSLAHENRRAVEGKLEIEQKLRFDMGHRMNETEKELAEAKRKIAADRDISARLNADLVAAQSAVAGAVAAQLQIKEELEQERNARSAAEKLGQTARDRVADLEKNLESERDSRIIMESKLKEEGVAMTAVVVQFERAKQKIAVEHDERLKAEERLKCVEVAFESLNRNWELQKVALREVKQTLEKEQCSLELANDNLVEAGAEIQRERRSKLLAEERLQEIEQALMRAEGQYAAEKEAHSTTNAALLAKNIALADEKTRRLAAERKTAEEISARLGAEGRLQQLSEQLKEANGQLVVERHNLTRAKEIMGGMESTLGQIRKTAEDAEERVLRKKELLTAAERREVTIQNLLVQEAANRQKAETVLADIRLECHGKAPFIVPAAIDFLGSLSILAGPAASPA